MEESQIRFLPFSLTVRKYEVHNTGASVYCTNCLQCCFYTCAIHCSYLERELPGLHDPYDLAVVCWALTKAGSAGADLAFEKLDRKKRVTGEGIYSSSTGQDLFLF